MRAEPPGRGGEGAKNIGVFFAGTESYPLLVRLGARLIVNRVGPHTTARLLWAKRHGLRLIISDPSWIDDRVPGGGVSRRVVCDTVRRYRQHDSLWGWYVVDEPSNHVFPDGSLNPISMETLQRLQRTVKRCDPSHPTLATFAPAGLGSPANPFAPRVADVILLDVYPLAPGNAWHPEWITSSPLPADIALVARVDPSARIWTAVQAFGDCYEEGCFDAPSAGQAREQIDLTVQVFREAGARLDGLLFFAWDSKLAGGLSEDMEHSRRLWPLLRYASKRLP